MWFTAGASPSSEIDRIAPDGTITKFPVTVGETASNITAGPDGNLWFTESLKNHMERMTTQGVFTKWRVPTTQSGLSGIGPGPAGTSFIAFAETYGNKIGWFNTRPGAP